MDIENKDNETPSTTSESRRKLVKLGLLTPPVIMSITSSPVHAVQGLSNMLSGNTSNCGGDNFYGGQSPGFWKKLTGSSDLGDRAYIAWNKTGFLYCDPAPTTNSGANYDTYSGGTLFDTVFPGGLRPGKTLREVLNEDENSGFSHPVHGKYFHLINGLLNCRYYANTAGGDYFMTEAQFWAMFNNVIFDDNYTNMIPPGYSNLADLIESNYHKGPGSDCPTE